MLGYLEQGKGAFAAENSSRLFPLSSEDRRASGSHFVLT
jgi:hypothetical protein